MLIKIGHINHLEEKSATLLYRWVFSFFSTNLGRTRKRAQISSPTKSGHHHQKEKSPGSTRSSKNHFFVDARKKYRENELRFYVFQISCVPPPMECTKTSFFEFWAWFSLISARRLKWLIFRPLSIGLWINSAKIICTAISAFRAHICAHTQPCACPCA